MTMTDLPLSGVVAGAVLLAGALAAVVLMARGRRADRNDSGDSAYADSWEQMEQRRRRKETVYATAAYLLLFCCAAVAAALSFHGLVGFGRQNLRLSGGWEYLVPFGLDGAAMFSAVIAVREASHGDASLGSRLLVWAFAGAAAWFNWVHAPRGAGHAGAPQFFAGMSLSAAILFDRALKQTRRAALREQGLVPRPLPQIRVVRWLRAPRETFRAWSLMLLEGVRTLDQAVEEVREERRRHEQERLRRKEQQRLDRAKVKALGRQHRGHGRREHRKPDRTGAEFPAAVTPSQVTAPGADPSLAVPSLPAQGAGGRGDDPAAGTAGPRLDSLEEKLAEIERQFG
ncbi:DUF2637 domain-containing protein [Streptomyces sp. WMMB 322]|uniref:DUF2637 domain-containing protein n=1 Tax=Streptomyces sp. WMMB 322 TaxID=1286821 RepID=UPI0006E27468|nr:DUF2637 domain-containing protein [Streptomyces sp. WMMB 322]SCK42801.1 Protein of unknown function [Streptomyces sp. WMMB 322]